MAMASRKQPDDLRLLTTVLEGFPEGASLEQIAADGRVTLTRRTLIRRLQAMVAAGHAEKTGASRASRYTLRREPKRAPAAERTPAEPKDVIPLSTEGSDVLRLVSRSELERMPVGYNRGFLDAYKPNVTGYLRPADLERLHRLGKTSSASQDEAGTYAQHVLNRLLIDLSFNSSRLEGNTYSLLDTQRLIDLGEEAEGKAGKDAQMILNHKAAIEFLVQAAQDIAFDGRTILNLHALLSENLLADPNAVGRLRRIQVGIGQSVYMPLAVPQLIEEAFGQVLRTASAVTDPFEQAFFVMVQLPYLQPFDDVNKRVSRLAANIPLIKRNLAPLSFVDVPTDLYTRAVLGVYELNRIELLRDVFLWAYERSSARYAAVRHTLGEPDPFRLKHRLLLKQVISDVVRKTMDKKQAARHIAAFAEREIRQDERARFMEVAETELLALHEGNFARYQVRPSEFNAWRETWNRAPTRKKPAGR